MKILKLFIAILFVSFLNKEISPYIESKAPISILILIIGLFDIGIYFIIDKIFNIWK